MASKINWELSPQDVTDLMRLVSIAAWVRAEQLADLDHMRILGPNDVDRLIPTEPGAVHPLVPPIILKPQLLIVDKARGDLQAAQDWFTKLSRLSEGMDKPQNPSWWTEHEPKKEA